MKNLFKTILGSIIATTIVTGCTPEMVNKIEKILKESTITTPTPTSTPTSTSVSVVSQGLVAYYSFDDGTAKDLSNNEYNGTIIGNPKVVDGIYKKALSFNEEDKNNDCRQSGGDYIKLPTLPAIWENGFSVCAWAKFKENRNFERIIDLGNGDGDSGGLPIWFGRESTSNKIALESWIPDGDNRGKGRLSSEEIVNNEFKFYVGTIDKNGLMKIYINGIKVGEKEGNKIQNIERVNNFIAHSNWCFNDPDFKGILDEIRIYNRPLTDEEIKELYKFYTNSK